jgi:hypothetical protein
MDYRLYQVDTTVSLHQHLHSYAGRLECSVETDRCIRPGKEFESQIRKVSQHVTN